MVTRIVLSRLAKILIPIAGGLGLLGLGWFVAPAVQQAVIQSWGDQIEGRSDGAASEAVRQSVALGAEAIPILTHALGSKRAAVALAARSGIHGLLEDWEQLSPHDSAGNLARLAEALADSVEAYGPAGRGFSSQVALRILMASTPRGFYGRSKMIADCDRLLRQGPSRPRSGHVGEPPGEFVVGSADSRLAMLTNDRVLIPDPSRADRPAPPDHPRSQSGVTAGDPLVRDRREANSGESSAQPPRHGDGPSPGKPSRFSPVDVRPIPPVESVTVLQHMRSLHRRSLAWAAEDELLHLGFTALEIQLAHHLTHPESRVRRSLVEKLTRLRGIDAAQWLTWLSQDADAEVRLAALSLMATSDDPVLLREMEQRARRDRDPQITQWFERLFSRLRKR